MIENSLSTGFSLHYLCIIFVTYIYICTQIQVYIYINETSVIYTFSFSFLAPLSSLYFSLIHYAQRKKVKNRLQGHDHQGFSQWESWNNRLEELWGVITGLTCFCARDVDRCLSRERKWGIPHSIIGHDALHLSFTQSFAKMSNPKSLQEDTWATLTPHFSGCVVVVLSTSLWRLRHPSVAIWQQLSHRWGCTPVNCHTYQVSHRWMLQRFSASR